MDNQHNMLAKHLKQHISRKHNSHQICIGEEAAAIYKGVERLSRCQFLGKFNISRRVNYRVATGGSSQV